MPGSENPTVIGVAAHISAAAPLGPRDDPGMSPEQRSAEGNGIWLCSKCHILVDREPIVYTAELLHKWKLTAKSAAYKGLTATALEYQIYGEIAPSELLSNWLKLYQTNFGKLRFLGRSQPMDIDQLYTPISVMNTGFLTTINERDELQQDFLANSRQFAPRQEKLDAKDLSYDKKFLFIEGPPGSGKSTFLKYFGLSLLKDQMAINDMNTWVFPLYVELKLLVIPLASAVRNEICRFGLATNQVNAYLKAGKFALLLDGLDELAYHEQQNLVEQINAFSKNPGTSANKIIVTCRSGYRLDPFDHFDSVIISGFDQAKIRRFIYNYFREVPATGDALGNILFHHEHLATQELV